MSENSKIEWCDATFNPWIGCTRVSPGCDHCYAAVSTPARVMAINWGPGAPRRRTSAANWAKPLAWNRAHAAFFAAHGRRQRVFCASLADVFDNAVDPQWRADLFALIEATPNLDWLLLTKRIGNVRDMVPLPWISKPFQHGPDPTNIYPAGWPANVWLGATVVNQEEADRDIPKLLAVPAVRRFLSMEPLLGPVDLRQAHMAPVRLPRVDWVIVGGESGSGARPMHPDWARDLRDQCAAAGVPFLFKQWGEWAPQLGAIDLYEFGEVSRRKWAAWNGEDWEYWDRPAWCDDIGAPEDCLVWVGKKMAGRLLDGMQHDGYPEGA